MAELTDIDRLTDMWTSSPDIRDDVETRYPGLAWIIERVIDPDLRVNFVQRSGEWAVGIPERMRREIRNAPCPTCFVGTGSKCITRSGTQSKFVHVERYLSRERWCRNG